MRRQDSSTREPSPWQRRIRAPAPARASPQCGRRFKLPCNKTSKSHLRIASPGRLFVERKRPERGRKKASARPAGRSESGKDWLTVEKFIERRPFNNDALRENEKIQGAQCMTHTEAVWIFSLTKQIAIFQRPANSSYARCGEPSHRSRGGVAASGKPDKKALRPDLSEGNALFFVG